VPAQVKALQSLPVLHNQKCERADMADAVFAAFDK